MIQGKAKTILYIAVIVLIVAVGVFGTREPTVTVEGEQLKISGLHGMTIKTDDISEIKEIKEDNIPVGLKIFGISFGNVRKGTFHYGDNGSAKVILESSKGPYIFITLKDDIVILNFKKADKTDEVYNYLKENIKK